MKMQARRMGLGLVLLLAAAVAGAGLLAQDREKRGIERKLKQLVIDHVEFDEATLPAVIEYLKKRCKELDPAKEGVNFILMLPQEANDVPKITIEADDLPLGELIRYLCMAADCHYKVESQAVIIAHKSQALDPMETRMYQVSPATAQAVLPAGARGAEEKGGDTGLNRGVQWPTQK